MNRILLLDFPEMERCQQMQASIRQKDFKVNLPDGKKQLTQSMLTKSVGAGKSKHQRP
jgi:hypothetical protein